MVNRSIVSRLGAAATLVVLGVTALLQIGGGAPAGAAGSSVVLLSWGDNSSGELGNGNTTNTSTPSAVSLPPGVTPTAISAGGGLGDPQPLQYAAYAIGSDGNLYAWGDNSKRRTRERHHCEQLDSSPWSRFLRASLRPQ